MKLLVANRGEIAVRIFRAASEMGIPTVAIHSEDDAQSLHTRKADEARELKGQGVPAYLDIEQILAIAGECGCDAIHPGYGFLSENAVFSKRCEEEGITFVGPRAETLETFGDKAQARQLAERCGVSLLPGISDPVTLDQARAFLSSLDEGASVMIKAISGGGGRGMRVVSHPDDLEEAYTRCRSEALQAFGNDELYIEQFMADARHIEVQIIGDGSGRVCHLYERECSIQRQHQKVLEIAPCPGLSPVLRDRLTRDAVLLAEAARYRNAGTFEFVVETDAMRDDAGYAFIEANARLQVEHTLTEEVMDLDMVKIQLQLAAGKSLADLGLLQDELSAPRGYAVQTRINMETMDREGNIRPSGGVISAFEMPSGRGIRTDTCGYVGYRTSPHYDSLLAKLIGHSTSPNFADAVNRTYRALCEFKIEGVLTNISFLQSLLQHPDFLDNRIHTRFVEDHIVELATGGNTPHQQLYFGTQAPQKHAGVKVDSVDPLAVLDYGKGESDGVAPPLPVDAIPAVQPPDIAAPEGTVVLTAPMQGTIVSIDVAEGDLVNKDQQILVMNAMKMEHVIRAHVSGVVVRLAVAEGDTVYEDHPLVFIEEQEVDELEAEGGEAVDPDYIRPDLAEVNERHEITLDAARPDAVAKRRKIGQRTARENVDDLCDPGTYIEYGSLVVAAQRRRRSMEDLIQNTPTDGMIAGIGSVNSDLFDEDKARCMIVSYDYMVLAGTQGGQNHRKKDRMFEIAAKYRLPIVFFTEGGGGRPGDTDGSGVGGLDCRAFALFGQLSGLVPLVGVNAGRCFAGNAAMLGSCDVVIAKENSSIGMGGPAMIEGGSLGVFTPEEVGPMSVQVPNGVVDVAVKDEAEGVRATKQYLSYFQGRVKDWECADQRLLRGIIPENRLRIYDVRRVIETMADTGSVLELRPHFGLGMVTALVRIEGRPLGVIANNPSHLAGAIDSPGADKAARFMKLCDAYDIPILFLADTPGMMVGPEIEKTALVRHCCRMFVVGGSLTVPFFTIVLRKAYGLGVQAMAGGSFHATMFTVSWPTGEFGGMGLEGQVKLGQRKELAAIEDPMERKKVFDAMVEGAYKHGKAINTASHFEVDDVIDPAGTRHIIVQALKSAPPAPLRTGKKRPCIDPW